MNDKGESRLWREAANKLPYEGTDQDRKFKQSQHLAKLLGFEYQAMEYWKKIPFTPELKRVLELINGPRGPFVIKVLEARLKHD